MGTDYGAKEGYGVIRFRGFAFSCFRTFVLSHFHAHTKLNRLYLRRSFDTFCVKTAPQVGVYFDFAIAALSNFTIAGSSARSAQYTASWPSSFF
jgi:hypothetical protein